VRHRRFIAFIVSVCIFVTAAFAQTPRVVAQHDAPSAEIAFQHALSGDGLRLVEPITHHDWAIATAITTIDDEHADPLLLIARRDAGGTWRALRPTRTTAFEYNAWLAALPTALIGDGDRDSLRVLLPAEAQTAQTLPPFSGYRLPYPESWRAFLSQGPFGGFSHSDYWALDLVLQTGGIYTTAIVAAKSGVVMYVKDVSSRGGLSAAYRGYANGVVIRHGPGEYSWYWHLAYNSVPSDVQPGRPIEAGTVLGFMGSTGYSGGPHLHFQASEAFTWAGCSAITGCPGRELREDKSAWNKTVRGVDFAETDSEANWSGCGSRASCAMEVPSSNALTADGGAVLYWSRDFHGPGWKLADGENRALPGWLSGRANSLAVPPGWWTQITGADGVPVAFETSQALLAATQRPRQLSVSPLMTVTKSIRNDLSVSWPYQFGSADSRVMRVTNAEFSAVQPCAWQARALAPGRHLVQWVYQRRGGEALAAQVAVWPFSAAAPCVAAPSDPGPPVAGAACADTLVAEDPIEPNNTPASAITLTLGSTQTHATGTPGDADWLTISTRAGARYALETRDLDSDADTVLQIYSPDGSTLLATNDDVDPATRASRLEFRAPNSANYRVKLTQWDPGISSCGTRFTVGFTQLPLVFLPLARR
jgi:hypothetical protein